MNDQAEILSIGISLQMGIGKEATIVFQTHVPQIAEAKYVNDVLDKLRAAAYRQQAKYDLEMTEFQLAHDTRILEQLKADFANVELREEEARNKYVKEQEEGHGRRGPWKRSEREDQHRAKIIEQIMHLGLQIKTVEQRISELRQKAA